mgnify:CR=1 FL=1
MDGIETLAKLKELGCNKPIYALTANAMSHEIAHYLALGFAGHLKKPIERDVFLSTIAQHYFSVKKHPKQNRSVNNSEPDNTTNNEPESAVYSDVIDVDISGLTQSFVKSLSELKQDILYCSNHKDIDNLVKITHKISGAAQMFGFNELAQSATEVELATKNHKFTIVEDLTHCLLDEITLVQGQSNEG